MHSATKLRSTYSIHGDNSPIKAGVQEILSCRPISSRRPLSTAQGIKQSLTMMNITDNDHANEILTHSILIDNAARRRGFLPSYYYRTAKTLEVIQRQRTHYKPLSKPPPTFLPIFHRSSSRLNLSENSTNITGDLTERNISLHDKSIGRNHSSLSIHDKQETKLPAINDNEFITEIPSSLELVLQNTTRKSNMERSLFEALKRQRSEHDRHRFLPINRAPYA